MEINFCRRCGSPLQSKGHGAYLCTQGHHVYYKSYPAAGALLVNSKNELLLTVRGIEPNKGKLDVPGGFCDPGETFEQAVARELQEELGLKPTDYGPLEFLSDDADIYDYEGERQPAIHVIFWGRIPDDARLKPADDVADFVWLHPRDIKTEKLSDAASIHTAIANLQRKLGA